MLVDGCKRKGEGWPTLQAWIALAQSTFSHHGSVWKLGCSPKFAGKRLEALYMKEMQSGKPGKRLAASLALLWRTNKGAWLSKPKLSTNELVAAENLCGWPGAKIQAMVNKKRVALCAREESKKNPALFRQCFHCKKLTMYCHETTDSKCSTAGCADNQKAVVSMAKRTKALIAASSRAPVRRRCRRCTCWVLVAPGESKPKIPTVPMSGVGGGGGSGGVTEEMYTRQSLAERCPSHSTLDLRDIEIAVDSPNHCDGCDRDMRGERCIRCQCYAGPGVLRPCRRCVDNKSKAPGSAPPAFPPLRPRSTAPAVASASSAPAPTSSSSAAGSLSAVTMPQTPRAQLRCVTCIAELAASDAAARQKRGVALGQEREQRNLPEWSRLDPEMQQLITVQFTHHRSAYADATTNAKRVHMKVIKGRVDWIGTVASLQVLYHNWGKRNTYARARSAGEGETGSGAGIDGGGVDGGIMTTLAAARATDHHESGQSASGRSSSSTGISTAGEAPRRGANLRCSACGGRGHRARDCP